MFTIGQPVTMKSIHGTTHGTVSGEAFNDSLPTGVVFVPVEFDNGRTGNVDSRVLSVR